MIIFIDDFSIHYSKTIHHDCVKASLQRYRKGRIALNFDKIFLVFKNEVLLGYIASKRVENPIQRKSR